MTDTERAGARLAGFPPSNAARLTLAKPAPKATPAIAPQTAEHKTTRAIEAVSVLLARHPNAACSDIAAAILISHGGVVQLNAMVRIAKTSRSIVTSNAMSAGLRSLRKDKKARQVARGMWKWEGDDQIPRSVTGEEKTRPRSKENEPVGLPTPESSTDRSSDDAETRVTRPSARGGSEGIAASAETASHSSVPRAAGTSRTAPTSDDEEVDVDVPTWTRGRVPPPDPPLRTEAQIVDAFVKALQTIGIAKVIVGDIGLKTQKNIAGEILTAKISGDVSLIFRGEGA